MGKSGVISIGDLRTAFYKVMDYYQIHDPEARKQAWLAAKNNTRGAYNCYKAILRSLA